MRGVVSHVTSSSFWWGVAVTVAALYLYRNYGSRLPRLPGGSNA